MNFVRACAANRPLRLPFPLQAGLDALLDALARPLADAPRIACCWAICCSSSAISSAMRCPLGLVAGPPQVALGVGQAVFERLQLSSGRDKPGQMVLQFRQPDRKVAGEIDELARTEAKGHLSVAVQKQGCHRLLVAKGAGPLLFADRLVLNAVPAHDEDHRLALLDGFGNLAVPVVARPQLAFVEPDREGRRPDDQGIGQLERKVQRVGGGVTDEVSVSHSQLQFTICSAIASRCQVFQHALHHGRLVGFALGLQDHGHELQILQHGGALASGGADLEFPAIERKHGAFIMLDLALRHVQQDAAQGRIRPCDALPEAQPRILLCLHICLDLNQGFQRVIDFVLIQVHVAQTAAGKPVQGVVDFVRYLRPILCRTVGSLSIP